MKTTIQLITLITALWGMASLRAAERWEGSDNFASGANSANLWRNAADHPTKGRAFVQGGEVRYSATGNASDGAWAWGKKGHLLPSAASWQIQIRVRLPQNSGQSGVDFTKGGIFVASPSVGKKAGYRALTFKAYQRYPSSGNAEDFPYYATETDYSAGGEREHETPLTAYYENLQLVFRHDALNQTDTYRVLGPSGVLLDEVEYESQLSVDPNVAVGFLLAGKPKWSGSGLAVDDWSVTAFTPDPIDLPALTKAGTTIGGSSWTLTIQNLRLVKAARGGGYSAQATGSLVFGSTALSIPVTGSIQRDGTFLLTGKGGGNAKGYGFTLRYDTYNRVAITGKSTVTAPRQKAIRF